jgi:hypothetical protein
MSTLGVYLPGTHRDTSVLRGFLTSYPRIYYNVPLDALQRHEADSRKMVC